MALRFSIPQALRNLLFVREATPSRGPMMSSSTNGMPFGASTNGMPLGASTNGMPLGASTNGIPLGDARQASRDEDP